MFYFPGSLIIGRIVEIAFALEIWPWRAPDWDDNDRRGAGSLVISAAILVGLGLGIAWLAGAF